MVGDFMCQQSINENVDRFCDYFLHQSNVINNLTCEENEAEGVTDGEQLFLHKQNLYVCLLDSLSSIRFHKTFYKELAKQNRLRFVRFIREYCDWPEGNMVSLPFLIDNIPKKYRNNSLAKSIEEKLNTFHDLHDSVSISDVDEEIILLNTLALNEAEEESIEYNQHYSILYRYRNYLVHESRTPGGSMQSMVIDETTACYHQYVDDDQRLYLIYPVGLMKRLLDNAIYSLRVFFKDKKIDPYERIEEAIRF